MDSKKINQLATEVAPVATDLTIIGNPTTGVSKKITLLQLASTIGVAATLQQITDNGATTTNAITIGGLSITGFSTGVLKSTSGVISSIPYGAANGVATLAGDGKVPSNQLPSYVDDVVEVANYAALPVTGETGKIYITLDNNKVYRWTGSIYVEIAPNNAVWGAITGTLSNQTDLQNALNAKLSTATAASTYVPYTGANANVDLGLFNLSSTSVLVTGTAGSGHIHFRNQSSTPNGLTNYMTMYSNAAGTAIGIINTGGNAALLSISALSANRTFTFPNASGTLALTSDISYPVSSVFGRTGAVVATNGDYTTDQVTEGSTNLYFTNTRARAALSFVAGSGAYNNTTGVITIPTNTNQLTNGAGFGTGSVTSVSLTTPTGLTTSGSPITTSGTLAVTFTAGYSIPTTASQSTWDTAYTNRITSLTTTGSSGASTLSSNVLNVPNYTLSGLGGQPLATNLTSLSGLTFASTSFVKMTAAGTFALDTTVYTSNTGTVTSVAASAGTGISISGSPITTSGTLTITNTAPDQTVVLTASTGISVTGSYPSFTITNTSPSSGGTVTSVAALTLGTSGTDLSSSVATGTTTPVITLNVPTASAANRGALSAADFTTFTNKQAAITLTTTGTSGAATFSSNTLNVPNYTLAGLGGLSNDIDSEQTIGGKIYYFNDGIRRMNLDPRWNESGYDADLGCLHLWSWTAGGVAYGRAGIALYNGSAYQYLTTKGSTTGIFLNNNEILHVGNYTTYAVPITRTLTINGTAYDLSANRSWTITAGVSGSGTQNYLTKWNNAGGTTIGNSQIIDNGTEIGIGIAPESGKILNLNGVAKYTGNNTTLNINTSSRVLDVIGKDSYYAVMVRGGSTAGASYGLLIQAGGNSSDSAFTIVNKTDTGTFFRVKGNGQVVVGTETASNATFAVSGTSHFSYGNNEGATMNIVPASTGQGGVNLDFSYWTGTGYPYVNFNVGGNNAFRITPSKEFWYYAEDNSVAKAKVYYNYANNEYRIYGTNASDSTTGIKIMEYSGSVYYRVLTTNTGLQLTGGTLSGQLIVNSRFESYYAIGPNDDVRDGVSAYDSTAMTSGVGGQFVFGYKYTSAGDYTQGAIIKMYKDNATSGNYSSGLKFQVRETGNNLSTKMVLTPAGRLLIGFNSGSEDSGKILKINGAIQGYITSGGANSSDRWTITDTNGSQIDLVSYVAGGNAYNGSMGMFVNGGKDLLLMAGSAAIRFVTGGYTEQMRVNNNGNISIGYVGDGGYKLYVSGTIYATADVIAYSDISVKKNIRTIENVLDRVVKSRGVLYDRNDIDSNNNIGFIAQELEEQFPELISKNSDGTKGVKYMNAVAVLFEAIKEQQKQIDVLKKQVA